MTPQELAEWAAKILGTGENQSGEIEFVKIDTEDTKTNILALYEAITGRTLARADPIRLFLEVICYMIVLLKVGINHTGRMNLLKYAVHDYLDDIGVLVGTERLGKSMASTTLKVTLSAPREQSTTIPKGTRVTADSKIFFAIENMVVIPAGELSAEVRAVCTTEGVEGNGYAMGEIQEIVDPVPFVLRMVNTTESEGGSDIEKDDFFRERIHQAPESFSCAGPDGAYKYHARRASALIADVSVDSPSEGVVEVRPLLQGGELPGEEILDNVSVVLNDRSIRPLTDRVFVKAPEVVAYNVEFSYWIDIEQATQAADIQTAVEKAAADFVLWQRMKLGRDLNPSELIYRVRAAGAKRIEVQSPVFQVLSSAQVAMSGSIRADFGGMEDG